MGDGGDYENGGEEGYAEKGQGYDGEGNAYAGEGGEEGQGAGYINQEGEEFGQDMEGGEGFAEEEENWQEGEAEDVYAMGAGMGNGPEGEEGFAEDGVAAFADAGEGYAGEDGNAYAGDGVQNQAELGEGYAGEGGGGDGREGGEGYAGEGGDGVEGEEGEGYAGEGGDGDAGEGYAGERGDGVAGEEEEGYAGEGGDGVAAEEGEEYAGEGGDGVAGEEGEGYAGEGGDGVAREEGEGYASEGGDGVAREEGEGYAGEGGDGVAGEEGEGYAGEGGGGVAGEEDQCDGENGAAGDGGEGGEPAQPHSHGAEDDDDIENIMYPGAQAMATQQSQASTMDEDVEEQRALERGKARAMAMLNAPPAAGRASMLQNAKSAARKRGREEEIPEQPRQARGVGRGRGRGGGHGDERRGERGGERGGERVKGRGGGRGGWRDGGLAGGLGDGIGEGIGKGRGGGRGRERGRGRGGERGGGRAGGRGGRGDGTGGGRVEGRGGGRGGNRGGGQGAGGGRGRAAGTGRGRGRGAAVNIANTGVGPPMEICHVQLGASAPGQQFLGIFQQQHISRAPAVVPTHQPVVGTGGPRPVAAAAPLNMGLAHSNRSGTAAGPPRINLSGGRVDSAYASQRTGNAHPATSAPAPARPGMSNGGGGRATMSTLPRAHMLSAGGASRAGVASYRLGLGGAGQPAPSTLAGHGSRMIPGLAPVVSPNSPVSLGRGWGSQRVNSAGGSTGQPNHTQRGWGPMASAGGGRAGAQPGGSNMGDRSQSNASGGGMNGVALGAAPSGRSSGSRGPDAAASTGSQRPVAVPRPGIGAGMPRPRAVASVSEKIAQNTYATMADLQALRDELLGQLCRRCAGCDRHDANGEGGGTQVEPVKEPVRVKSPEEIACDFINAETGGWQGVEETLQGVEETLQGVEEPLQGTEDPNLLLSPHLRLAPALLSAWQSHCKARKILTCSFPPISVPPLPYSLPGRNTAGRRRATARHGRTTAGVEEPLQGTKDSNLLLSPHLRLAPALLSAWQSHCKARKILTCSFPPISSHCKARQRLKCSFPPISVSPLPYSLPGRATAGRRRATAGRRRTTAGQEWGPGWHVDDNTMWPFSSEIFNAGIFAASVRSGMALGVWKTRQIAFALFALEYPILEKTADGKLSSKPDYNLPLYEEKVKWCRRWVEHAVTNLGVGYVEDRDVFVFGNGILIDASDYAAGFKKTTIVLQ
ncbi:unnamed protein product [Closterium sp. NIES-64]|nr:unnamed protein product [Closterium sp. NIES-64]